MATKWNVPLTNSGEYYFISYNSGDSKRVESIVKKLTDHSLPVWYDYGIPYGGEWQKEISRRIYGCKAMILFLTKSTLQKSNTYVEIEYEIAKNHFDKPVYVVFLEEIKTTEVLIEQIAWYTILQKSQNLYAYQYSGEEELAREILIKMGVRAPVDSNNVEKPFREKKYFEETESDILNLYRKNYKRIDPQDASKWKHVFLRGDDYQWEDDSQWKDDSQWEEDYQDVDNYYKKPYDQKSHSESAEVSIVSPKSTDDVEMIVSELKRSRVVVMNLEKTDLEISQQIVDQICGYLYASKGELKNISSYLFIATPEGIEISGSLPFDIDRMSRERRR